MRRGVDKPPTLILTCSCNCCKKPDLHSPVSRTRQTGVSFYLHLFTDLGLSSHHLWRSLRCFLIGLCLCTRRPNIPFNQFSAMFRISTSRALLSSSLHLRKPYIMEQKAILLYAAASVKRKSILLSSSWVGMSVGPHSRSSTSATRNLLPPRNVSTGSLNCF